MSYVDAAGREQVRTSQLDPDRVGSGTDLSRSPKFLVARAKQRYFGPVYFVNDSRPFMTVSRAELAPGRGAVVAEIDLRSVQQVIERARVGTTGYAYAVDSRGELVTHPNIDLVLRHTSFALLPQVRAAIRGHEKASGDALTTGRDQDGTKVLSAFQLVEPVGWRVFVEQPLSEAFAPLKAAIWRTALLLVAFLLLAIATSVLLARRLVRPIESVQAAAAKIGSGSLDQRIEIPSNDELGALAEEFNRMAARLKESYSGLEQKVEERTRELATALAELDEKGRQLEAASRHKSEFLANMSHELRTPLNAIIGFSQVLGTKLFGEVNEKQAEYLEDILTSANHLLALINDILDLSKVEAGQIELDVAPFSLQEALERGVVMMRERAVQDGVQVALALNPGVDVVDGDERRIRQVIFNLLSNAVKFTPAGGAVDVGATQVNGEVRVSVADTGPGIAPEDHRADLRGVPADRGGSRAARGDGPRPRAVEAARRAARRPDLGRQRARQGKHVRVHAAREARLAMAGARILVVEDNEKNMKLFRDVLQAMRYSHPGGDERRAGGGAGDRAWARPRAHGRPAAGHRRRRVTRPAACGRAHRLDTGRRRDRAGDGG